MADTKNDGSRKLENLPIGQEESRRKNVADTANFESRESEGRPQDKEGSKRKNMSDTTNVESRESEGRPHEGGSREVVRADPSIMGT